MVETFNGSITVVGSDGDSVEATVTKRGEGPDESVARHCLANIDVSMRQEGEVIYVIARLEHSTPRGHAQASVTIRVPSKAAVELETDNGPVRIRDLKRTVTTRVTNGKIEVEGGSGLKVDLTTNNGDVEISGTSVLRSCGPNQSTDRYDSMAHSATAVTRSTVGMGESSWSCPRLRHS